jgi:hypothetical protein
MDSFAFIFAAKRSPESRESRWKHNCPIQEFDGLNVNFVTTVLCLD